LPAAANGVCGGAARNASRNGGDVHREASIDDYDEQLDFGTRELAEELRALEQSNMEEAVDNFISALQADLILPEDF